MSAPLVHAYGPRCAGALCQDPGAAAFTGRSERITCPECRRLSGLGPLDAGRWCCPLCGYLNDSSLGQATDEGHCQGIPCVDRRGRMVRLARQMGAREVLHTPEITLAEYRGAEA